MPEMDTVFTDDPDPSERRVRPARAALALLLAALAPAEPGVALAQTAAPAGAPLRDGSHDFDWEIGRWTPRLRYLAEPLTGSSRWIDYHGTTEVRALLGKRANIVELSVEGTAG